MLMFTNLGNKDFHELLEDIRYNIHAHNPKNNYAKLTRMTTVLF